MEKAVRTEALYNADLFFGLPEAGVFEQGISPIGSRHQPLGFSDGNGDWWVAILSESEELKRKRM